MNLSMSIVLMTNIAISTLLIIAALGLRRRRKAGLIFTYVLTIWVIIGSIGGIVNGEQIFMGRLGMIANALLAA